MTVVACRDIAPAVWLVDHEREWYDLTARGPLGYERYARVRFIPDPAVFGQRESDADIPERGSPSPSEIWQVAVAVANLACHTRTADECYYLLWEGWPGVEALSQRLGAARLNINDERTSVRGYYLFRGDADLTGWGTESNAIGSLESWLPIPAFIWPADRAWCVVRDVDPHFATIGASAAAIADVLADPRIDVVVDDPTVDPPRYC